jgi:hypothetical protein
MRADRRSGQRAEGTEARVPDDETDAPGFDTSVPHIARIYDYWLGRCFL